MTDKTVLVLEEGESDYISPRVAALLEAAGIIYRCDDPQCDTSAYHIRPHQGRDAEPWIAFDAARAVAEAKRKVWLGYVDDDDCVTQFTSTESEADLLKQMADHVRGDYWDDESDGPNVCHGATGDAPMVWFVGPYENGDYFETREQAEEFAKSDRAVLADCGHGYQYEEIEV